jgi:hypothetical protein
MRRWLADDLDAIAADARSDLPLTLAISVDEKGRLHWTAVVMTRRLQLSANRCAKHSNDSPIIDIFSIPDTK